MIGVYPVGKRKRNQFNKNRAQRKKSVEITELQRQ